MKLYCAVIFALLSMVAGQAAADNSTCIRNKLVVAGAKTVYPVTVEWAYGYKMTCNQSDITVEWDSGKKRLCGVNGSAPAQIGTITSTFNPREAALQPDGRSYRFLRFFSFT